MVVAEIPLWLVHAAEAGGAGGIGNPGDDDPFHNNDQSEETKAQTSLSLLQSSGRGKKCAIYGVDINPDGNRIATCGGDGTVRIWSLSGLFSRKRSRFADDGNYASSEASAAGESSSSDDADEDNNNNNNPENGKKSANGEDNDPARESVVPVHDLTSLVRRKKGGEMPRSPTKPAADNNTDTTTTKEPEKKAAPETKKTSLPQPQQQQQQQQRLLCTLSAHTGSSVLAVRFSHDGRFLASAGDDAAVCIYTKDSSSLVGNLTDNSLEHWSRIKLCRGHGLDVVGLAWAPDDSTLVSCSLDSETPIIVWKLTDLASNQGHVTHSNIICNPYKVLGKGTHTSTVKGVTFDPAGTYLASSGDDPSVCIWRAHDDWGLERRIDAGSGIFRRWKEDNSQSLSSQTLFRRLSWSTDGAYICSTNCVVKNKHVASTISRDGWNVSTARTVAAGAANLVGHKQPVVVSRHCSKLLEARSSQNNENGENDGGSDNGEEDEPAYATLLALGDRHGFVTVWTTRKSRPIFKLQCSESRCTVTDLAWGKVKGNAMVLLVSLLDGHCVALRFKIPEEVGPLLADKNKSRLFRYRYGIDLDDAEDFSRRRLLVGESSGPKFIENTLQMSLESRLNDDDDNNNNDEDEDDKDDTGEGGAGGNQEKEQTSAETGVEPMDVSGMDTSVKSQQQESQVKGKKRIRPVLMSVDDDEVKQKKPAHDKTADKSEKTNGEKQQSSDPLQSASNVAEKAASLLDSVSQPQGIATSGDPGPPDESATPTSSNIQTTRQAPVSGFAISTTAKLPHRTDRFRSVDLPVKSKGSLPFRRNGEKASIAECANSYRVPLGSKGGSVPCIDVSISKEGAKSWKDQIVGTSCSALAASDNLLAVGTADGSIQLYGTSPSLGWDCGTAFRSHPLLVLGHPIVSLQLHDKAKEKDEDESKVDLLVVTGDGSFGVYEIFPVLQKRYKGSLLPAMSHMSMGASGQNASGNPVPRLSRLQLTESDQLLLLLSFGQSSGRSAPANSALRATSRTQTSSAYGAIQAFVYNLPLEMWLRISDGRFVLSDFYTSLPASKSVSSGTLSQLDDAVRIGALDSTLDPSHRSRTREVYQHAEDSASYLATRSHCEDRMACAVAVGSSPEFKHWLRLYVRTLSLGGHADLLRVLVDMIVGPPGKKANSTAPSPSHLAHGDVHWWLSTTPTILTLDRKSLIKSCVIPEMSKNRALQRLTNEVALEVESLASC
ncbi:Protein HIR1 [Seminavis robusta]|uniref:Protein HIR1 n=1 Tax=Seminavis robusta TaxID=568900 RepID=A0A9N8D8D7_9STRA|nr:Protein HIR1 [Seminavis robusta]|eukprot:Sro30_g019370.1 Protein HIR1 (1227) ;mRNA; r:2473-6153